jgi:hypothetical protein
MMMMHDDSSGGACRSHARTHHILEGSTTLWVGLCHVFLKAMTDNRHETAHSCHESGLI